MTDSEQKEGGLPTAAYEWRYVDWDKGHTVLRHEKPDRNSFDVELELKHELVRRKDVKTLIQDKIEDKTHNVSELKGKWQIVLEELLEELEQ